jgi:hypothetical protein
VGLGRQDAFKLWARDVDEIGSIRSQYVAYQDLKVLRSAARPMKVSRRSTAILAH